MNGIGYVRKPSVVAEIVRCAALAIDSTEASEHMGLLANFAEELCLTPLRHVLSYLEVSIRCRSEVNCQSNRLERAWLRSAWSIWSLDTEGNAPPAPFACTLLSGSTSRSKWASLSMIAKSSSIVGPLAPQVRLCSTSPIGAPLEVVTTFGKCLGR